jgi:hypothetical protein
VIVFDLKCGGGHVFEAWFGSSQDYDDQQARGLVSCPLCGAGEVDKAPMAPRLADKAHAEEPSPQAMKKMLEGSDNVGERFPDEARAIHLGEAEARAIHGKATPAAAKDLIEDGIEVAPLPFPVPEPGEEN